MRLNLKWHRILSIGLTVTPLLLLACTSAAADFIPIGDLPGGDPISVVDGLSPDGAVAVGTSSSASGLEAYYWTKEEGMVGLGDLRGGKFESYGGAGVTNDGAIIVGQSNSELCFEPFIWTRDQGMQGLGSLREDTCKETSPLEGTMISEDGTVVVGTIGVGPTFEAFRWTRESGMQGLGFLPGGTSSRGIAPSHDGSIIIGDSQTARGTEAYVWTEQTGMQVLPDLPGGEVRAVPCNVTTPLSAAAALSSSFGLIIVGGSASEASGSNYEAVIWTKNGVMTLGDLPGGEYQSLAYDVSDNGIAIGESSTGVGRESSIFGLDTEAFVWDTDNGMRNLKGVLEDSFDVNLDGWILTRALAISNDGLTIVGWGINPDGFDEGWLVTLPEGWTEKS